MIQPHLNLMAGNIVGNNFKIFKHDSTPFEFDGSSEYSREPWALARKMDYFLDNIFPY